jgi:LacI family transcriptional regulator
MDDDLGRFCCLNPDCPDHGKRGHGNLTVPLRYGPGQTRRLLRCSTCKARFSERKGTPLFDARLPTDTAIAVLAHVAEGVGTRKTGGSPACIPTPSPATSPGRRPRRATA